MTLSPVRRFPISLTLFALAALPARAQHLTLTFAQATPAPVSLLEAAAAPERFAGLTQPALLSSLPAIARSEDSATSAFSTSSEAADDALPASPSSLLAGENAVPAGLGSEGDPGQLKPLDARTSPKAPDNRPVAPLYTKYIPAGWAYRPIHGREKFILGARDLYSPGNFLAIFASTGYSHLTDGQPNYGVNSEAFAKRLGAIAIRETAQGIFTDGVFAVIFHQDPRYFAEGPQYNPVHRALYAATRPLIVRTTDGKGSTVNTSLLAGYAATALLNNAYYPQINRNVKDTLSGYGTSLGGAALGFVVSEFTDDALEFLHLKRKP